ncbi:PSD1 and planctomycete cytochrome C domain-containing protein [Gemmata sp. JC673]|uniref:PSD1 and planctomycete cytochrome C domain-containing protein n=1 Tax=Gemmata algarum TaxID=2975278 RepID=A0ABU5ES99_9BACT|nr:PSD1 and planctomycete cytochrome C domain-containing protein [Gemmata algarum]MDY3557828.1 PSD1 and planctomycete cytochrome C domain-containing protein [Gemmata algarum]
MRTSLALVLFALCTSPAAADDAFEKEVRPLLVKHCVGCHGPEKQKGGLRLDTRTGWETGGDSGPAIRPRKPDESLFIKALHGKDGLSQMPPAGKLPDRDIAALTKWVRDGAADPRTGGPVKLGGVTLEEARKWWAFQPVRRPAVPNLQAPHPETRNEIDRFVLAKLEAKGLKLAPAADKRTLLRRATYDLTGLPPTPEAVDAFLKDDAPDAFAKVVDRLLASPHYGERWGRHWLDLVRYADTAGENSDHPLPHAWRYRNWVIDAFNRDMPYDEFLREQLAGDLLAAKGPPEKYAARVVATGYLALARRFDHDSDKFMHLTHEDGIDTLGKAFLGLTLGCARCHDHKYDAVTARDYYALYGIFESTKFAFPGCEAKQQPRDLVPLLPPAEWDRVVKPHRERLAKLDAAIRAASGDGRTHAQAAQAAFAKSRRVLSQGEISEGGDKAFDAGEIEIGAGEMLLLSITPLKNHGADTTLIEFDITEVGGQKRRWSARDDLLRDALASNPHADGYGTNGVWWLLDARNQPTLLPESVRDLNGKPGLHARRNGDTPSVLVNSAKNEAAVWTKLPPQSLFVHPAPDGNVAIGWLSPIAGKVTIRGRVKDAHPGGPDGVGWVLERFAADVRPFFAAQAEAAVKLAALTRERAELLKAAPTQEVAFAVTEGQAADARLHLRGDPEKLGDAVPRRWLEALGGTPITDATASGRLDLANWVASKDNPLTARVMANRIWLHHFGKGLVATPNDFGTRGAAPTHPELLDWLASEFVRGGWKAKALHRAIMLSQTYQQDATHRDAAAKVDPTNELYWRFERRRLSAEEMRDTLLAVSGQLDRKPGAAHPFPPESAWSYTQHVPFGTFFETDKRSVYLVQVRNRRHPFLGLFDGADPNATTPQRQTTTVPTQALYFLNDPFFHAQAEKLSARVLTKPEADRASELFRLTLQRPPAERDRAFAATFLNRYQAALGNRPDADRAAWAALSRVVLASNEFLFVE